MPVRRVIAEYLVDKESIRLMNGVEIYKDKVNQTQIEVRFEDGTVWLTQHQMALLFKQTKQNISLHINNCFKEKELTKKATVKDSLTAQNEGNRLISSKLKFYNLDVIISTGLNPNAVRNSTSGQPNGKA